VNSFSKRISAWGEAHDFNHPWKKTTDPYSIWISEIILQQTRVKQGLPYFQKFLRKFPTLQDLASASEQDVLSLWEGLGYYTRARNLHASAQWIVNKNKGKFPSTYKQIIQLKGVGPYSAAAICSFAFDIPVAVLDGNVYRVLSRYFGIAEPIHKEKGQKLFRSLAQQQLPKRGHAHYNQAIMDFGANQCIPVKPNCLTCPLSADCEAYKQKQVSLFPVKKPRQKQRTRYFNYLVIQQDQHYYINKRDSNDIWRNLYEFPLIETREPLTDLRNSSDWPKWIDRRGTKVKPGPKRYSQLLSHQRIEAQFWELNVTPMASIKHYDEASKVHRKELKSFPFPKIIRCYLENN